MMETMLWVMDVMRAVNKNLVVMATKIEMVLMISDETLMMNNVMMAIPQVVMDVVVLVSWKINVVMDMSIQMVQMISCEPMMMNIVMKVRIVMMLVLIHVLLISNVETCDIQQALPVNHVISMDVLHHVIMDIVETVLQIKSVLMKQVLMSNLVPL